MRFSSFPFKPASITGIWHILLYRWLRKKKEKTITYMVLWSNCVSQDIFLTFTAAYFKEKEEK